jgi:hypothetical protein
LSEAHAQAATSATHCGWYSAGLTTFPKGNNNNSLRDANDTPVQFTSAGAGVSAAFALAGSGVPFNKTTHNGQASGVADVNGNIYKINPGLTCIAATKTITAATQTNPVTLKIAAHDYTTGAIAMTGVVGGMTQLSNRMWQLTVIDADTVSLDGCDGTAFGAFTSGGTLTAGKFYALKPTANVEAMTAGATLATCRSGTMRGEPSALVWVLASIRRDRSLIWSRSDGARRTLTSEVSSFGARQRLVASPANRGRSVLAIWLTPIPRSAATSR